MGDGSALAAWAGARAGQGGGELVRRSFVPAVLLAVAAASSAGHAGDTEAGQVPAQGVDATGSVDWEQRARAGDAEAQYRLGLELERRRSEQAAEAMLGELPPAPEDGSADGEQALGNDAWPDPFAAVEDEPEPSPLTREEVEARFEEARWFRLAAEQGHPMAQFELHKIVLHRERNRVEALMWLLLASRNEQVAVRKIRPFHYEIAKEGMSPAQIREAERRAGEWKPRRPEPPAPAVASSDARGCPCWPGGASEVVRFHKLSDQDPNLDFEECVLTSAGGEHRLETRWVDATGWEVDVTFAVRSEVGRASTGPGRACRKRHLSLQREAALPSAGAIAACVEELEKAAMQLGCSP